MTINADNDNNQLKRKRSSLGGVSNKSKSKIDGFLLDEIPKIKKNILDNKKNWNDILKLIEYTKHINPEVVYQSIKSIQSIICNWIKTRDLVLSTVEDSFVTEEVSFEQSQLTKWTQDIFQSYQLRLFNLLNSEDAALQVGSIECYFNIIKQQAIAGTNSTKKYYYPQALHYKLMKQIFKSSLNLTPELVNHFIEKFALGYDDTRYHVYNSIFKYFSQDFDQNDDNCQPIVKLGFDILSMIRQFPTTTNDIQSFWGVSPTTLKETLPNSQINHPSFELKGHRKVFTDAWITLLKQPLSDEIFKRTLLIIQKKILPNINQPLLMLDFLTISYDQGGVISLLSLNGLFELINKYHVDYPQFYEKLYKLLDWDLLHVKYRSRFFRMMELFLSSTHLSSYLVASFIKRLSRLTLMAPPSGIVIVIPVVYNLLMAHPSCLGLIHRTSDITQGTNDPFNMAETDLNKTEALQSSIWELHTLTNHYHPTVSSLAKVFSEKMNKPNYHLEEFLDHTYNSMMDSEFNKPIKKTPALSIDPPKTLFGSSLLLSENDELEEEEEESSTNKGLLNCSQWSQELWSF